MNELNFVNIFDPGETSIYAVMHLGVEIVQASDGSLVTRNSTNWHNGKITLSDVVAAGYYIGSVPAGTPAGYYVWYAYQQIGGSAALSDPILSDPEMFWWDGSSAQPYPVFGIVPVSASFEDVVIASSTGGVVRSLSVFQNTLNVFAWTITDGGGNPVDLTGNTIKMLGHAPNTDTVLFTAQGADVVLTESDPSGHPGIFDTINVTVRAAYVTIAGQYVYKVRDTTAQLVYGSGPFVIQWAP